MPGIPLPSPTTTRGAREGHQGQASEEISAMTKFARSRALLAASLSAALMSLLSVVSVFAGSSNGPFPK